MAVQQKSTKVTQREPELRRLIAACRHKPTLAFYQHMDSLGTSLVDDYAYADWQRGATMLKLQDRDKHRSFQVGHRGFSLSIDQPVTQGKACSHVRRLIEKASQKLDAESYERAGVRFTYVCESNKKFSDLCADVEKRFFCKSTALSRILDDVNDVGFVVDCKCNDKWGYVMRLGPMVRKQWFEVQDYSEKTFRSEIDFQKFQQSIPETFFYVDIDYGYHDVEAKDVGPFVEDASAHAWKLAKDLSEYLVKGGV